VDRANRSDEPLKVRSVAARSRGNRITVGASWSSCRQVFDGLGRAWRREALGLSDDVVAVVGARGAVCQTAPRFPVPSSIRIRQTQPEVGHSQPGGTLGAPGIGKTSGVLTAPRTRVR
jgi:hypothetical protein